MPPNQTSLEYEEEDLFGSDDDSSALLTSLPSAKPVPSITPTSSCLVSSSKTPRIAASNAEKRLAELRSLKRGVVEGGNGRGWGVSTLKSCCLTGALCLASIGTSCSEMVRSAQ